MHSTARRHEWAHRSNGWKWLNTWLVLQLGVPNFARALLWKEGSSSTKSLCSFFDVKQHMCSQSANDKIDPSANGCVCSLRIQTRTHDTCAGDLARSFVHLIQSNLWSTRATCYIYSLLPWKLLLLLSANWCGNEFKRLLAFGFTVCWVSHGWCCCMGACMAQNLLVLMERQIQIALGSLTTKVVCLSRGG